MFRFPLFVCGFILENVTLHHQPIKFSHQFHLLTNFTTNKNNTFWTLLFCTTWWQQCLTYWVCEWNMSDPVRQRKSTHSLSWQKMYPCWCYCCRWQMSDFNKFMKVLQHERLTTVWGAVMWAPTILMQTQNDESGEFKRLFRPYTVYCLCITKTTETELCWYDLIQHIFYGDWGIFSISSSCVTHLLFVQLSW